MWRRSFGRPRNDIVLPAGWYLTASSIPATISQTDDGRVRLVVRQSAAGRHRRLREGTAEVMLKGTRTALVKKIQPVSIHGQISLDVYFVDPDDPQGQVSLARLGPEAMPRHLEPGDRVDLHYVLGVVTSITKASG